jgi:hypothetical protein
VDGASFLATLATQQDTAHRAFQQIVAQLQGASLAAEGGRRS